MPSPSYTNNSESLQRDHRATRSSLIVAATGTGKTVVMGGLARSWPVGRVMMISHRYELNRQSIQSFESICGEHVDLEQSEYFADQRYERSRIVVASVQTLNSRRKGKMRMERFNPMEFGLLMIDEAHHATANGYRRVIDHFQQNPDLRLVGVTATPDRLDGVGLGHVFDEVACNYDIRWGVDNGWLVAPRQVIVEVERLDLRDVHTVGGDLDQRELARVVEREENLHGMAKPIVDFAGQEKQAIVFTASVQQAHRLAELIRDYHQRTHGEPGRVESLDGTMSPQDPRRKAIVERFKNNEIQYFVNCGIACLDEQTEILTSDGWVGIDGIHYGHKVACWNKDCGSIEFHFPLGIEVRDRRQGERMVVLETPRRSIRVTDNHRMVYMTGDCKKYKVDTAIKIADRHVRFPICGLATPMKIESVQEDIQKRNLQSRIRSLSYLYRKQGNTVSEARAKAEIACLERSSMRRVDPSVLTKSDLHLIGMWVGDGTKTALASGGIEYSISQSTVNPSVCDWIRKTICDCGIDFVERKCRAGTHSGVSGHPMIRFSMPRGTGFGQQKRRGVFHIEPFLSKTEFRWLMGLTRNQFIWFIEGLWMADGDHKNSKCPTDRTGHRSKSWRISSAIPELNEWIQIVGVCRNLSVRIDRGSIRRGAAKPLFRIAISDRLQHIATKYRFQVEPGWKHERVWCVKSETGFIVTRRKGTVSITGNTEGFDSPNARLIAIGRPTKSRALYTQMVGRGTRPLPGVVDGPETAQERIAAILASAKPHCDVLDFIGQSGRHSLACVGSILAGDVPPDVIEAANRRSSNPNFSGSTLDAIRQEQQHRLEMEELRRKKVTVGVEYRVTDAGSLYDMKSIPVRKVPTWWHMKRPSEKQQSLLIKLGYTSAQVDGMTMAKASAAIDHAIKNPRTACGRWMAAKKREESANDEPIGRPF